MPAKAQGAAPPAGASKIFIHVANFYPETIGVGKYAGELAFSLAGQGHTVEVVAAPPHYPGWTVAAPYHALKYQRENIRGVDVWRCPILTRARGGVFWRVAAPLTFALFAAPLVFFRILWTRPDVVFCVEPAMASFPAALAAAKLTGARAIAHVQDLEIDAAFAIHLRGEFLRKIALALESRLLRAFDLTATISHKMRDALLRKGVAGAKCVVFRNWVDLDAVRPLPDDAPNPYRAALGLAPGTFVTLYSGHIGKKQALDVVIEAARLCRNEEKLHFVIAGEGPEKARMVERCRGLDNVSFLPLQPAEFLNDLLNLANLHVLPQLRSSADLVLPSKLAGMLASGRPVAATAEPDSELGEILRDAAFLTPPEDAPALADAIKTAMRQDLRALSERSRELAKLFSAETILAEFEAAIRGGPPRPEARPLQTEFQTMPE
ncbi:WcaI family glycosyltransferase [Rhodoblastus acidophilus]|uniref:WcaI family glycosyltransferase n=1 Tax=Candidatus Rhodoblastus alkanivorans TaxID=2954117 RepID=A0ABS9Z7D5_9HYPH|nr:WcaI family glycosyltransferase [Candidatus Rhodoblastus alkanivorans]MCI4679544.1 WcaI family glycosyltransferase [Candidatus Rhodoblastus alkanivorans]MCI4683295.1 WcaI family glycosyltransferase [Candidatus Rhodoblastus alkanivorans]MDI4640608.1 WcaI family glycosyltransferase [Rhodoblastus acidophilus]